MKAKKTSGGGWRSSVAAIALSPLLCGFGIVDEVDIGHGGSAKVRRTVSMESGDSGPESLERLWRIVETRSGKKDAREAVEDMEGLEDFRKEVCRGVVHDRKGPRGERLPPFWDSCEFLPDGSLAVEKSVSAKESAFSSAESSALFSETTANVTRYLSSMGAMAYNDTGFWLGTSSSRDESAAERLEELREAGFGYEVVFRMPGDIKMLWGAKPEGRIREVRVDMLEMRDPPAGLEPHEADEFIVSESGWTDSPHLKWALLIGGWLLAMRAMRAHRPGRG